MFMRSDDAVSKLDQPRAQLHREFDYIRKSLFDFDPSHSRLEGKQEVRRMGERNSFLRGIEPEIQVARQLFRGGDERMIIKNHREARKSAQAFTTHARGQVHPLQINWNRSDRANAIQA